MAGRALASPDTMLKREPCQGHTTWSPWTVPSLSGPPSWVQVSSIAKTSPSRLNRAIRLPSTSTSVPLPSTSSSVPSVSGSSDSLATLTNWAIALPFPSFPFPPLILIERARLLYPKGLGGDVFLGLPTGTSGSPGRAYRHQHPHLHVAVAEALAREARLPQEVPHHEHRQLRLGHRLRLALQKLDPA